MTLAQLLGLFILITAALVAALRLGAAGLQGLRRPARGVFQLPADDSTVLLFDDDRLLDATAPARALFAALPPMPGGDWQKFLSWAGLQIPGAGDALADLQDRGLITLGPAPRTGFILCAEWHSGIRRITLSAPDETTDAAEGLANPADFPPLARRLLEDELSRARTIIDQAPLPVWSRQADGRIGWANSAYLDLLPDTAPGPDSGPVWPLPVLFAPDSSRRVMVPQPGGAARWFDPCPGTMTGTATGYALPADAAERAERTLASFVHTLSVTFAQLPIGLAIFDERQRLRLFNPALTDLTRLPVEFLAAQPSVFSVLDAMRARGTMPEPRDYARWREDIAAIGTSQNGSRLEENWSLPNGQTYAVTGNSHSGGGFALLIEDITESISHTRRMRADVELGQAVIDSLGQAIAVFGSDGRFVLCNPAYARLWGHDPGADMEAPDIGPLISRLRGLCAPARFWDEVLTRVSDPTRRDPLVAELRLLDGRAISARLVPLARNASMLLFTPRAGQMPHPLTALPDTRAAPRADSGYGT